MKILQARPWKTANNNRNQKNPPCTGWSNCTALKLHKLKYCTKLDEKACTVLNFPLLPHSLPLSASLQFSHKLAENLSTTTLKSNPVYDV